MPPATASAYALGLGPTQQGATQFGRMAQEAIRGSSQNPKDASVVEIQDDQTVDWSDKKAIARELLLSRWFDPAIGTVIFLNAVSIAVDQTLTLHRQDTTVIKVLESTFLCVYMFELVLRYYGHGLMGLKDPWVRFDVFLIATGVLTAWIIEPCVADSPGALGLLMVLRTARLLRLAKLAKQLAQVREFWMLVRGFLQSASLMMYTFILLFFVLFIFSSLGIELITKHRLAFGDDPDPDFKAHVEEYFPSILMTMCTLVRFVCMDDMSEIYKPLIDKDGWLSIYFMLIIIVIGIVIMNLVAAVIYSSTIEKNIEEVETSKRDQEEEWSNLIRDLKEMFHRLDVDGSGQLSRDEVLNIEHKDQRTLCQALGVKSPVQVFEALDVDKSGQISINEFFDGVWDIALAKAPVDLKRIEKQVEGITWRVKESFRTTHEMNIAVNQLIRTIAEDLNSLDDAGPPPAPNSSHSDAPGKEKERTGGHLRGANKSEGFLDSGGRLRTLLEQLLEDIRKMDDHGTSSLAMENGGNQAKDKKKPDLRRVSSANTVTTDGSNSNNPPRKPKVGSTSPSPSPPSATPRTLTSKPI